PSFPSDPSAATEVVAGRLRDAGTRIATVDLTSPDTYLTPFRVARAVGVDVQPIHFGYRLRPLANPRLKERLGPSGVNPFPHPIA
ncbi:MAG: hypothetical protein MI919_10085, partial [Holophagales bacterium]|nr:hypothetical protein [Holophagales bacterium]